MGATEIIRYSVTMAVTPERAKALDEHDDDIRQRLKLAAIPEDADALVEREF
jgi:hypothetical protein